MEKWVKLLHFIIYINNLNFGLNLLDSKLENNSNFKCSLEYYVIDQKIIY